MSNDRNALPTSSGAPSRKTIHTRRVHCTGYQRSDGLFDIEAELHDISAADTDLLFKVVPAGGAIHHMRVIMTVDRDLVIQDLQARLPTAPTPYCAAIEPAYSALKGLQIRGGFRQQVKSIVGGVRGCTHLTELLGPMATTAMQTILAIKRSERSAHKAGESSADAQPMPKPQLLDSCHTYRQDGMAAKILWPESRRAARADA